MKSYGQFCPVAQALDVVGDRWTLLVIRELLAGSRRFGEILNGVRRIPRSVLTDRLESLERAGLLQRELGPHGHEYEPTEAARALEQVVLGLGLWSRRWAHRTIREDELDPTLLLWDMQRRIDAKAAPARLLVVRFDLLDSGKGYLRYWLKICLVGTGGAAGSAATGGSSGTSNAGESTGGGAGPAAGGVGMGGTAGVLAVGGAASGGANVAGAPLNPSVAADDASACSCRLPGSSSAPRSLDWMLLTAAALLTRRRRPSRAHRWSLRGARSAG